MRLPLWSPEFTRIARTARTCQRLIFLATGALLFIIGIALRNSIAFVFGIVMMGSFAFDAPQKSPTSAHVRMWQWLHKNQATRP